MHLPLRIPRAMTDATSRMLGRAAASAPTPTPHHAPTMPAPTPHPAPAPTVTTTTPTPVPAPSPVPAPVPETPRTGFTTAGIFGMTAGTAGLAVTAFNGFKDFTDKQGNGGSPIGPSTLAIGGGAALMLMAHNGGSFIQNSMRGAGALAVLGGIGGASAGAIERIRAPKVDPNDPAIRNQAPTTFAAGPPATVTDLAGIELGIATVKTIDKGTRGERDVSVYLDPATAVAVPTGSSLEQAIAQARALSQGDAQNRSHAVVQTKDGAYAIARLTGELDQVDGRNFAADNTFDREFEPHIDKLQPSLQAIIGVERNYDLRGDEPVNTGGTAPLGDIPWVTPQLVPAAPTTTTTPKPAGN